MCAANEAPAASGGLGDEDFRQQLKSYSHFFNRLVEMVPAKYYFDNTDEDPKRLKYMKKGAKVDAKRERKEAAKKRKREKLDPDKAQTALDVQVLHQFRGICCFWILIPVARVVTGDVQLHIQIKWFD